jgi:hypothetical protein
MLSPHSRSMSGGAVERGQGRDVEVRKSEVRVVWYQRLVLALCQMMIELA